MTTLSKRLTRAMQQHEVGQLPEAERLYCEVLEQQPNQANALCLLGLLAYQVGNLEVAITYCQQALTSQSNYLEAHNEFRCSATHAGGNPPAIMPYLNVPAADKMETGRGVPQLLQNKRRTR